MAKQRQELTVGDNEQYFFRDLEEVRAEIKTLKKKEEQIKLQIREVFGEQIKQAYAHKGENFGAVSFVQGDNKITFTTPKKVTWDQTGLEALYKEGAPVKVKYDVSETVYKTLDAAGQAAFMPYRTVEEGTMTIEVEAE